MKLSTGSHLRKFCSDGHGWTLSGLVKKATRNRSHASSESSGDNVEKRAILYAGSDPQNPLEPPHAGWPGQRKVNMDIKESLALSKKKKKKKTSKYSRRSRTRYSWVLTPSHTRYLQSLSVCPCLCPGKAPWREGHIMPHLYLSFLQCAAAHPTGPLNTLQHTRLQLLQAPAPSPQLCSSLLPIA